VTAQRRATLAALSGEGGHLTAEEVYQRARRELPELSRATVYNTLGDLVGVGLLRALGRSEAVRYELNGEDDHQHFRCLVCGRVYDVHPRGTERLDLSSEGFAVDRVEIVLEGRCPECLALERGGGPSRDRV
jgi:Fe2+ or Zn2+ uptake regulation protein